LPNITLHHSFYLHPQWRQGIELYDPFELLGDSLRNRAAFVLGTRYTNASTVMMQRLSDKGLSVKQLDADICARVDELRQAIYADGASTAHSNQLGEVVAQLSQQAAVVIACSELSVALQGNKAVVDLASLQINAFVGDGTNAV
ncbi:MAG: hypothetical protein HKO07_03695, partial [Pseudomonadales bacterium]|nr:hypothetical protein [Pseudomonadales bacterium]